MKINEMAKALEEAENAIKVAKRKLEDPMHLSPRSYTAWRVVQQNCEQVAIEVRNILYAIENNEVDYE